jgi:hypothetical protein
MASGESQQFPVIELERLRAYRQEPVESLGRQLPRQKWHRSRNICTTSLSRAPVGALLLQIGFDPQPS